MSQGQRSARTDKNNKTKTKKNKRVKTSRGTPSAATPATRGERDEARLENEEPSFFIYGAGKVGVGLAKELRRAGLTVSLRAARQGLPSRRIEADFIIIALRDRDIAPCAEALRDKGLIGHKPTVVVHCAGALGPAPLAAVKSRNVAVAQMHPMISFASRRVTPSLERGQLHVDGDPRAVRTARAIGRVLGMSPRTVKGLDRVAYHAAAGLVANGAAALAAGGLDLLERAGVGRGMGAAMLGPLLRSVAENVERMGLPAALTGPVRRGDAAGIEKHLETLRRLAPHLVPLYVAASRTQLPLARELAEAPPASFKAIEALLAKP
jgi:predicted short-subunit dehydrogenase-like oxidoreductase (DUF2520 family)